MQNTAQGWLVVLLATPGVSLAQAAGGRIDPHGEAQANLYLGLIATAGSLPVLFGSLYGGVVADRASRRTIIMVAQAAQGCLALLMSGLIAQGHIQIWHVVVLAALLGVSNVFDIPARQSFVVEMVGKEDLPNAIALNSSIFNAARAFGPAAAGLLLAAFSHSRPEVALARCFLFNGLSYLAVIAGLFLMRGDFRAKQRDGAAPSPLTSLREVYAYLDTHRPALLLFALVAVFSVFTAPYWVLLPSLARFTLHIDGRGFGILMSASGAGALVGALTIATTSEYAHKGRVLTGASLLFPLLLIALSQSRNFALSCGLLVTTGFTIICFLATANTLLQTSVPDSLRGRIMSVYSLILIGLTPVGSLWAGAMARIADAPTIIAVGASVVALAALATAIRYPRFRTMGRTLPPAL